MNNIIHEQLINICVFLAFCLQGRRPTMEDRFVLTEVTPPMMNTKTTNSRDKGPYGNLQDRTSIKIYAVFDGHGGEVNT